MSTTKHIFPAVVLALLPACNRGKPPAQPSPAPLPQVTPASQLPAQGGAASLRAPVRLLSLPFSAYNAALGLDAESAYLMTRTAAYRLTAGKPARKMELDLGVGPVLADSGIVFWSKRTIWNAAKESGTIWRVAELRDQPEYFVASDAGFAWLDRVAGGPYRIATLDGKKPRELVTSTGELSAVHMIHDWVYFVEKAADTTWRIGRARRTGGEPEYTDSRSGPTPAMLAGTEAPIYYDMGRSEILQLAPDLKSEHVWLKDFVCSPIHEAGNVYCSRVEGLFAIAADTRKPKPLLMGGRETITAIRADSKRVVWISDAGPDQLAVDMLPLE